MLGNLSYTFQFQFLEQNHRASGPLCDRYTFVFGTVGYKWKPEEPRSLLMRQNINFRPRVSLSCVLLKSQCFNLWSLNIFAGPHPRTSYLVNSSLTLLEWYSRWDLNSHDSGPKPDASCQLGYWNLLKARYFNAMFI